MHMSTKQQIKQDAMIRRAAWLAEIEDTGMPQVELAAKYGIHRATMSKILAAARRDRRIASRAAKKSTRD